MAPDCASAECRNLTCMRLAKREEELTHRDYYLAWRKRLLPGWYGTDGTDSRSAASSRYSLAKEVEQIAVRIPKIDRAVAPGHGRGRDDELDLELSKALKSRVFRVHIRHLKLEHDRARADV
jgi:hypothetical protein